MLIKEEDTDGDTSIVSLPKLQRPRTDNILGAFLDVKYRSYALIKLVTSTCTLRGTEKMEGQSLKKQG